MNRKCRELRLPSVPASISRVENFIDEICEAYYITNSWYGNILLAITEAVKNAIDHGNANDPEKTVKIIFKGIPNGLCFTVKDQGTGFDHEHIRSPLDVAEGSDYQSGNGIFLIRSLSDRVIFNRKGNQVDIVFYISSVNHETSLNRVGQMQNYFSRQRTMAK